MVHAGTQNLSTEEKDMLQSSVQQHKHCHANLERKCTRRFLSQINMLREARFGVHISTVFHIPTVHSDRSTREELQLKTMLKMFIVVGPKLQTI